METERVDSAGPVTAHRPDRIRSAAAIAATLMIVLAGAVVLVQIEVTGAGATRGCGSVVDSVVDRSGWEQWWAGDLDEPDEIRAALVRTSLCPDAVNQRLGIAAALVIIGLALAVVALERGRAGRSIAPAASATGRRVTRIGRLTSVLGGALTLLGVVAIAVLIADSDSTLLLYTDRLVVAVVGLIVLIPTITLFVIGRVLVLFGENVEQSDGDRPDA